VSRPRSRGPGSPAKVSAERPERSNLTVLLGVAAIVLGLGSLALRLMRGEGIGFVALLAIALGVLAIAVSGRLRNG
jgi:hypothetical protein